MSSSNHHPVYQTCVTLLRFLGARIGMAWFLAAHAAVTGARAATDSGGSGQAGAKRFLPTPHPPTFAASDALLPPVGYSREIAGSQRGFQFVTQLFFALPHRAAAFWRGANCSRSYWPEITSVQRIAPVRLTALVPARQSGVCTLNAGGWLCSLLERSCSWVARCA